MADTPRATELAPVELPNHLAQKPAPVHRIGGRVGMTAAGATEIVMADHTRRGQRLPRPDRRDTRFLTEERDDPGGCERRAEVVSVPGVVVDLEVVARRVELSARPGFPMPRHELGRDVDTRPVPLR